MGEASSRGEQELVLALVHSAEHTVGYDLHLDPVVHSAQQRRVNNNDGTTHETGTHPIDDESVYWAWDAVAAALCTRTIDIEV